MRFGIVLPFGDARSVADGAVAAEAAGCDAIFVWEAVWGIDAWVSLTAASLSTERIRVGTLLSPLPRMKPWDLASRVLTLDQLSGGRVQLCVGLGALHPGWTAFEADQGRATRAQLLDEGLDIYAGLMRGQPFRYAGRHYRVEPTDFMLPGPSVQRPHPPVWVVGAVRLAPGGELVRTPSLDRAARWEGLLPNVIGESGPGETGSPDTLAQLVALTRAVREEVGLPWAGYDVIAEGRSHGEDRSPGDPAEWAAAGATWWVEGAWDLQPTPDGRRELDRRIAAGPPGT